MLRLGEGKDSKKFYNVERNKQKNEKQTTFSWLFARLFSNLKA
jgi:hypothetical protein